MLTLLVLRRILFISIYRCSFRLYTSHVIGFSPAHVIIGELDFLRPLLRQANWSEINDDKSNGAIYFPRLQAAQIRGQGAVFLWPSI